MLAAAVEMVDVVRPQSGRPPGHSEEAAEGERDYPEQGQAPPCAATAAPGRAQLGAAPEHPRVHGGAPAQGQPPREAKFGARGGRAAAGGRAARAGLQGRPPHRARGPILSLLRTVFSGSWSPPCRAPQRIRHIAEEDAAAAVGGGRLHCCCRRCLVGGLSGKAVRGKPKKRRVGRLLPDFQGSRSLQILPKSCGRGRVPGVGSGRLFRVPPGGSSLPRACHPPPSR